MISGTPGVDYEHCSARWLDATPSFDDSRGSYSVEAKNNSPEILSRRRSTHKSSWQVGIGRVRS